MQRRNIFIMMTIIVILVGSIAYWRAHRYDTKAVVAPAPQDIATAYFAGGCFWCMEADFEKVPGVTEVISGYQGGHLDNPTYPDVVRETTGHREAVEVRYDPMQVSYGTLVEYFFAHIDPTDAGGAFVDRGESYTSAIFYQTDMEKQFIDKEISRLQKAGGYKDPIVTSILPFSTFWPAEEYHQDYYKKNPLRYEYYRGGSGRDARIKELCDYRALKGVPCMTLSKEK